MKYLLLSIFVIFLSACATNSAPPRDYEIGTNFNVAQGQVRTLEERYWNLSKGVDAEFIVFNHNPGNWSAVANLIFKDNNDGVVLIRLLQVSPNDDDLSLQFKVIDGGSKISKFDTLKSGIKFGEPIRVKVATPNESTVSIEIDGETKSYELGTAIESLAFSTSSAKASIRYNLIGPNLDEK